VRQSRDGAAAHGDHGEQDTSACAHTSARARTHSHPHALTHTLSKGMDLQACTYHGISRTRVCACVGGQAWLALCWALLPAWAVLQRMGVQSTSCHQDRSTGCPFCIEPLGAAEAQAPFYRAKGQPRLLSSIWHGMYPIGVRAAQPLPCSAKAWSSHCATKYDQHSLWKPHSLQRMSCTFKD